MMKVIVLHYSKLTRRKQHILEQFEKHGITDYEFIEKFDKDTITDDECPEFSKDYVANRRTELSIHLKHLYLYRRMVSENYEEVLVLEDDVILSDHFVKNLTEYMTQLPKDYDMLFIGNGCNLHIPKNQLVANQYIYEKCLHETAWGGNGATRCVDSYILNRKCAKKLCDYVAATAASAALDETKKINQPADWWLNEAARDLLLKVYWAEPTIVSQGSQNGLFSRSI
jgi:GR25 family glycosyltransferase involved in LPS biosynthesis